jgi:hypothetical protein
MYILQPILASPIGIAKTSARLNRVKRGLLTSIQSLRWDGIRILLDHIPVGPNGEVEDLRWV